MSQLRRRRTIAVLAVIAFAAVLLAMLFLMNLPVSTDFAFICKNTGSRKGHRESSSGAETGHWYKESELERFMKTNHLSQLQHKWTSYQGIGKNVFGTGIVLRHRWPRPIILLDQQILDAHVRALDDPGKKALYELFASGDESRVEKEVNRIRLSGAQED